MSPMPLPGHKQLEMAKWLAVAAMTVDHYGKIVAVDAYAVTNAVGRVSFPLFAWIVGVRLAISPQLGPRYLRSLAFWALVSQPFYVFAGNGIGEPNVFFTLLLGVAAFYGVRLFVDGKKPAGAAAVAAALLLSPLVDYSLFGVMTIPAVAILSSRDARGGAWALGPLGVLGNVIAQPPYYGPGAHYALIAGAVALATLRFPVTFPRMPKLVFYTYYPLHLALLRFFVL